MMRVHACAGLGAWRDAEAEGLRARRAHEKAPEPPPTSSMVLTPPSCSFFLMRYLAVATEPLCCACVYVCATSGSENHDAYEGASPVVITSGSAPMRW